MGREATPAVHFSSSPKSVIDPELMEIWERQLLLPRMDRETDKARVRAQYVDIRPTVISRLAVAAARRSVSRRRKRTDEIGRR